MIRVLTCLLLASVLNFSFGKEVEPFRPYFEVLSVKKDRKISRSKCLIEGQFYDYRTGQAIGDVTVERDGDQILLPDGSFAILMKLSKPSLKMYKLNYNTLEFDKFELKGGHRIKLRFYLENKADEQPRFEVKKPVIYAYSAKDLDFSLTVKPKGDLSFVYPPMEASGKWKMQLKDNQLYDLNSGLAYPYLFWESRQYNVKFREISPNAYSGDVKNFDNAYEGCLVSRSDLAAFLDSSLTEIGFDAREKTDFMTFWAPQMLKYNYCLIQFLFNGECNSFATYDIHPQPD